MNDHKMIKKDFIASVVLIAFSVSIIVMSYTMPRLERRNIDPFSAPGVVPGMIGIVLLLLALILFVRSIRHGGYRIFHKEGSQADESHYQGAVPRVLVTLFISLIYAIGCLGRFDYSIITAMYIFTFICLFELNTKVGFWTQKRMLFLAALQAVVASALITVVFQQLFLVDLP